MKDIYNNGVYFQNNPDWDRGDSQWKAAMIGDMIRKNGIRFQSAAEVGCGAGGVIQSLQEQFPEATFSGYDISEQAIRIAKEFEKPGLKFFNLDFTQIESDQVDLLLMIDVTEHVQDYYLFLEKLKNKSRYFIFHIPLDLSCRTILKPHIVLQQRQSVGHIHYFSEEHVLWILNDCGYRIVETIYTKPAIDLERQVSFKNKIKKGLRSISYSLNRKLSVKLWGGYSLLILAE